MVRVQYRPPLITKDLLDFRPPGKGSFFRFWVNGWVNNTGLQESLLFFLSPDCLDEFDIGGRRPIDFGLAGALNFVPFGSLTLPPAWSCQRTDWL